MTPVYALIGFCLIPIAIVWQVVNQRAWRVLPVLVLAFFATLGGFCLLIARPLGPEIGARLQGQKVSATITHVSPSSRSTDGSVQYRLSDGRFRSDTIRHRFHWDDYSVGQSIEVIVSPDNPENTYILTNGSNLLHNSLLAAVGVLLWAIGYLAIPKRNWRDPQAWLKRLMAIDGLRFRRRTQKQERGQG